MPFFMLAKVEAPTPDQLTEGSVWTSEKLIYMGAGIATLLLVCLGVWLYDFYRNRQAKQLQSPEGLFVQLCRAHKLSYGERRLLKDLHAGLPESEWGLAFLDPRVLHSHYGNPDQDRRITALGEKLFGELFATD